MYTHEHEKVGYLIFPTSVFAVYLLDIPQRIFKQILKVL